jgi:hypothetical protein
MNEVEQLEQRISSLSSEDLSRFRAWFHAFEAERGTGSRAGELDDLIEESLADFGSGSSTLFQASRSETLAAALRRASAGGR